MFTLKTAATISIQERSLLRSIGWKPIILHVTEKLNGSSSWPFPTTFQLSVGSMKRFRATRSRGKQLKLDLNKVTWPINCAKRILSRTSKWLSVELSVSKTVLPQEKAQSNLVLNYWILYHFLLLRTANFSISNQVNCRQVNGNCWVT